MALCRTRPDFDALMRSPDMAERAEFEAAIGPGGDFDESTVWTVFGQCFVCNREVEFWASGGASWVANGRRVPNWREHCTCPGCGLNGRLRASFHLFEALLAPRPGSRIYLTEQVTAFHRIASSRYGNVVGSEWLGPEWAPGSTRDDGIRHEDLQNLSFADAAFDFILTFDVLEHVPDHRKVLQECRRVLAPGGAMLMTVPFMSGTDKNVLRARLTGSGDVEHILPAQYHGNPLSADGSLVFNDFGWELLDDARATGFDPAIVHFWSDEYAYLGANQLMFVFRAV